MSRNGTGTYTLPAGNPVVTGTTISSTWANNTLSDIATALTQSLAKDGQTVPTANIPLGGFKITGLGAPTTAGDALAFGSSLGSITAPSLMGGAFAGLRNRVTNGNFYVDQRNAGASQTITAAAALAYTADRFYAYCTGANVTGQRVAGTAPNAFLYRFTGAGSVTKIGFAQRIENVNCQDLAGSTATLSVDLSNSLLTTVTWTASYANSANTFGTLASPTVTPIATGTFTVNSTLTRYSVNISIPSAATTGIQIELSVAAQTSGTWNIGNVQLEFGSVATPFEQRPYGMELALCQRYLPAWFVASGSSFGTGQCISTTAAQITLNIPVTPRVAPTGISASGVNTILTIAAGTTAGNTSLAYASASVSTLFLNATGVSGLVAGHATQLLASGGAYTLYGTGCEL